MSHLKLYPIIFRICGSLLLLALSGIIGPVAASATPDKPHSVVSPQLPLLFEQNRGQFNASVDYVARGRGYSIVLAQQPVIELFRFRTEPALNRRDLDERPQSRRQIEDVAKIQLRILGAREDATSTPLNKQQALTHYLVGESSSWNMNIANFKRVRYGGVLPDIDVEYYGRDGRLEYDFVVHPGGDPGSIRMHFEGAHGVSISEQGDLVIDLGEQQIVQRAPVSYQLAENGERTRIVSSYTISDDTVGFQVAAWDAAKTLVIDPVLEYSRYYGGAGYDRAFTVDLDAAGNIYVIGTSSSTEGQRLHGGAVIGRATAAEVGLARLRIDQSLLGLLDRPEHRRSAIGSTVDSDTEVDAIVTRVARVLPDQFENGIGRFALKGLEQGTAPQLIKHELYTGKRGGVKACRVESSDKRCRCPRVQAAALHQC